MALPGTRARLRWVLRLAGGR